MKKKIIRILAFLTVCSFIFSVPAFAETVMVICTGITEPNKLVSFMVTDGDADTNNLDPEKIHATDIIQADSSGNYSKTFQLDNVIFDPEGNMKNYKILSNVTPQISIVGDTKIYIYFDEFQVSPVEENGVLYVPIDETLKKIGGNTVSFTYNEDTKTYTGTGNNGEFTIVVGKNTLEVDWVDIELPGHVKEINGTNMMPAYAVQYVLKTGEVDYSVSERYLVLSEGVKEKGTEWDVEIADVVDQLPEPVKNIITPTVFLNHYNRVGSGKEYISQSVKDVEIDGQKYKVREIKTNTNEFGEMPPLASVQAMAWSVLNDFNKGEIGLLSFKARATEITDESGVANVLVVFEESINWSKALKEQVPITSEWKQYYFPVYNAYKDLPANWGSRFFFGVGGKSMTLQVADFSLVSFGVNEDVRKLLMPERKGYKGIEEDAVWRQEAKNRIEKYRKEDISIEVKDINGNPVPGAKIDVKLTENEFMFGAALCEREVLDEYLDLSTIRGQTLDRFMNNDMNAAVCADMLKAPGVVNTDAISGIKMVNEYLSRGKRVRGHTIFWDQEALMPFDRYKTMPYDEIYKQTMDYVRALAYTFKGKLVHWDVLNEPHDSNYIRLNYNTTRLYTDIFKEVKKIDPDVKLYVNETGIEGKPNREFQDRIPGFLNIVKQMQMEGAPIEGIGIQAHCTNYYYPQGFYHQLDECSKVVDEIAVTEYDFQNIDDTYAPNHLEDMMLATFSHPKATAFIVWGIEDSMHWRGTDDAPFFNRDWTSKPAYDVWKRLTEVEFATNATLTTDESGRASIRAFRGDYEITCSFNGNTVTVLLGNTVDGGSAVHFVVKADGSISGVASNGIREKKNPIKFKSMSEAKREYDSIYGACYKGVILDHNFKGSETTKLAVNGGDLQKDVDYQNGKVWGSVNGTNGILHGGDSMSTIIYSDGTNKTGDLRKKAGGKNRYENVELHHETMFHTLNATVPGTLTITTGVATSTQTTVPLGHIVYNNENYFVQALDGHMTALESNEFYTLDTAISVDGKTVKYVITKNDEIVDTHSCSLNSAVDLKSIKEVCYLFETNCGAGNIFKLHNSRLYEYKDGELIKLSNTDYESYVLDESMRAFNVDNVEYLGKSLNNKPEEWSLIGETNYSNGFGYMNNGHYLAATKHTPNGEHSLAKGFDKITDGESIELTFHMYLGVYDSFMDSMGYGRISLGSYDRNNELTVAEFKYTPYNDDVNKAYELRLLDVNNAENYAGKQAIHWGSANVWRKDRLTVKMTLTPSDDGTYYDANISVKPRTGSEEITASYPGVLTAEQAKALDTLFISSRTYGGGSKYIGYSMFGVKNLRLRKYGKSMYAEGAAHLANGENASLGIMYNNITGVYKPSTVVIAGYDETGTLISCEVKNYTMLPGAGSFNFSVNGADTISYYKVFLMKDLDTLIPYKGMDVISLDNN